MQGRESDTVIPPELGYGDRGAGDAIPGGATLRFDVEVVDIVAAAHPRPRDGDTLQPRRKPPGDPRPTTAKAAAPTTTTSPTRGRGGVFATDPDEASHTLILYAVEVYGANDETMKIVVLPDDRTTTARPPCTPPRPLPLRAGTRPAPRWRPAAPSRPRRLVRPTRVLYPPADGAYVVPNTNATYSYFVIDTSGLNAVAIFAEHAWAVHAGFRGERRASCARC